MKVTVDPALCKAYANCLTEAPDVFDFSDETGKAYVIVSALSSASVEDVRRAVASCPVSAITLVE